MGFRVLDAFASRHSIALDTDRWEGRFGAGIVAGREVACLEPQTHMNASGRSVRLALDDRHEIDPARDLMVIYDDLDLTFGRLRIRPSGSGGGHRGVESIIEAVGSPGFPRMRFGVGRPTDPGAEAADYVLAPFAAGETEFLVSRIEEAVDAVDLFLAEGIGPAMDRFNSEFLPADSTDGPGNREQDGSEEV